jgi:hypothetical protein
VVASSISLASVPVLSAGFKPAGRRAHPGHNRHRNLDRLYPMMIDIKGKNTAFPNPTPI